MFNESTTASKGKRDLEGTAQLTTLANRITSEIVAIVSSNLDKYQDAFDASKTNHSDMDSLISLVVDLPATDFTFLKELDEAILQLMLKSQQSKRSRAKSGDMTMANYKSMMSAAVAENLLRYALGKPKSVSSRRDAGAVLFTAEELQVLSDDQWRLGKALRNVQSKKSIANHKEDFDATSEYYVTLLASEQQLKDIRVADAESKPRVDATKTKLAEVLADVDITTIKAGDSKELLARIAAMLVDADAA